MTKYKITHPDGSEISITVYRGDPATKVRQIVTPLVREFRQWDTSTVEAEDTALSDAEADALLGRTVTR